KGEWNGLRPMEIGNRFAAGMDFVLREVSVDIKLVEPIVSKVLTALVS
ncbi:hypothetical protein VITU9109_03425, partial [Vibrio tubiashii ATCC 19109]